MRTKSLFPLFAALLAFSSCSNDSLIVKTDDGTKVRIQAMTEEILRVSSVPAGASFSKEKSLVVLDRESKPEFVISKKDGRLSTARVSAVVDPHSGNVSFYDADGKLILQEDRREFSPIEVEGTKGWTVRQVFKSDEDEGFYGLGQHQADEFNYKGLNEELYQYNTKISVPFIYSTKHYGILWDSYSFCRWGDPRDYAHLNEVFKLYDKNGVEGALTGTYVPMRGETLVRREEAINQEYLITPKCEKVQGAPDFNFFGSDVSFEGEIEATEDGIFRFLLYYAGYTKVYLDGTEVVPEIWRTAWNPNSHKFNYALKAGERVPIRIEWQPDGGVSYCGLRVLSPVDEEEQAKMSWWGEMQDQIDYYYIAGDNADSVISGYRTLTGKAPIMPKWAMGYWQSRERYTTQDEVVGTMREFRDRGIPVDNIVQDWQYWKDDQWGSHEFDEKRFPDPVAMVDSIHAMNGRFMISVWPKFYQGTEHFDEFDSKGWMYKTAITDSVIDWLGYMQSFYDAYDPGARKLFWQQMYDHLYPLNVDAWWMDASEPNIHDCTDMDYRKKLAGPTALGPSAKYFNAYALMNAQAIYEGQRSVDPDRRVFLLTRNGFSGLQRYSTASWSGDIGTRWEDMKTQISAGLNYSLSGIPFWGQDIGGFSVENRYANAQRLYNRSGVENADLKEWRELQARWHEWGVFCPLYRAHGQYPTREPWNIAPEGHPAYEAIVAADRLRYELMPYIYTMAARVYLDDYTIMRPLVMDFGDDLNTRHIGDQFMFGDAIMVCPVYEYQARSREIYLPEGLWYDFYTGECLEGAGNFLVDAPYDHCPVYVRAGSIIVTQSAVESTAETAEKLIVNVWEGADADFTLYEDDGLSYNYENGDYALTDIHWDNTARKLTVSAREGNYAVQDIKEIELRIKSNGHPDVVKTYPYSPGTAISLELN